MSEFRQLHRSFWDSDYVEDDLDAEGAWIYVYLIAGPRSNMEGLYRCSKRRICRQTKLELEIVDKWLRRLEADGKAGWLKGWVCVTQATRYIPHSPNMMKHAAAIYEIIPPDILAWALKIGYQIPQPLCNGFKRFRTVAHIQTDTIQDDTAIETVFAPVKAAVGLAPNGGAGHGKKKGE